MITFSKTIKSPGLIFSSIILSPLAYWQKYSLFKVNNDSGKAMYSSILSSTKIPVPQLISLYKGIVIELVIVG